ncbi:MAG TPA: septum formation initiator family protein [Smithellaceae bacterium]|nr:septum formation initiator family protein [Smithellaceae bacterium]
MKIGRYLVVFLFLMTILIAFGNRGIVDNYLMSKRLAQLKTQNKEITLENDDLKKKIFLLRSNLSYMESIARNELGMVKKGDIVYRLAR